MPKQSFNIGGYRLLNEYKVIQSWVFPVLLQRIELMDGTTEWIRAPAPAHMPQKVGGLVMGKALWLSGTRRVRNGFFGAVEEEFGHYLGDPGSMKWHRIRRPNLGFVHT